MNDRAVSEVLGYVLIISVVVITVGAVMTIGMSGLEASQEAEHLNNMERAFDVFDSNLEKIARQEAPSRATEIRLGGGSIGMDSSTRIVVDDVNEGEVFNRTTSPIVYSYESTEIIYDGGILFRIDDGNAYVVNSITNPNTDDTVLLPFRLLHSGEESPDIQGERTVLLRVEQLSPRNVVVESPERITIESERPEMWDRHLADSPLFERDDGQTDLEEGIVSYAYQDSRQLHVVGSRAIIELNP